MNTFCLYKLHAPLEFRKAIAPIRVSPIASTAVLGIPSPFMDLSEVDPRELQRSVRFARDLVAAHRIAKGLVINQERVTAMRETLEERLAAALSEFDIGAMPSSWSWQKAAETLSVEIALQLIREQKNEPLDPAFQKE
ncbi:MAG: hypothetical protein ACK4NM_17945 [Hydrogenophaga sp.]